MANRRRGVFSLPEEFKTNERLSTKKELAERRSLPSCPHVPFKPRKATSFLNPIDRPPRPLCFSRIVGLSTMYHPDCKGLSYLEQCFYELVSIGEGSFGQVYRARFQEDHQLYAIKRQKPCISTKDIYAEVLNNEKVQHFNCAEFYMAWEQSGEVFLMLEHCDASLADYAFVNNDISEALIWDVLYDICLGLDYLHKKQLIHLDVKPGNIMMKRGHYKIADFGTLVDLNKSSYVRKSTLSDGDAKYLALEVLDRVYHPSCDIFGLGISLLELSSDLELPSHGPLWQQLRHKVLPVEFYNKTSLGLSIIIERMLDPEYNKRPAAEKLLKFPNLKMIAKRDRKNPRIDYVNVYRNPETGVVDVPLRRSGNNVMNVADTPPCNNNVRCFSAINNFAPMYGSCEEVPGPSRNLGRKSLFKLLSDEPLTPENQGGDLTLAHNLESTMEVDVEYQNKSECGNVMITTTPNLRCRRMPKSKLIFE